MGNCYKHGFWCLYIFFHESCWLSYYFEFSCFSNITCSFLYGSRSFLIWLSMPLLPIVLSPKFLWVKVLSYHHLFTHSTESGISRYNKFLFIVKWDNICPEYLTHINIPWNFSTLKLANWFVAWFYRWKNIHIVNQWIKLLFVYNS